MEGFRTLENYKKLVPQFDTRTKTTRTTRKTVILLTSMLLLMTGTSVVVTPVAGSESPDRECCENPLYKFTTLPPEPISTVLPPRRTTALVSRRTLPPPSQHTGIQYYTYDRHTYYTAEVEEKYLDIFGQILNSS